MGEPRRGRFQLSLRTFLVATAVAAALFAPVAWVARERQQMRRLHMQVLDARELAIRSVVREEQVRGADRLRAENEDLRRRVEQLRLENEDLRRRSGAAATTSPAPPARSR
ncbi:hypothetical protein OJF2_34280 [Aquisphaera giovannonii]|uniref:Uncharacterized protein n=1 Tax=Aquisphaera giovannonii TaxID=406548 RepID=A0A5B9W2P9_9BACT|nr:hypothetical protein [Aquisphaera giovannonii]QEH34883.1 hypothetical protein OJF2_34280 [Aquisphaera giovannonii]